MTEPVPAETPPAEIPPSVFIGVAVEHYHSPDIEDLPGVVTGMRDVADVFRSFGYTSTVIEDPSATALDNRLGSIRETIQGSPPALVVAWSGHGADAETLQPANRLRLLLTDTADPTNPRQTWQPESILHAIGGGADQTLIVIDACHAGLAALDMYAADLDRRMKTSVPVGPTGWLGVITSAMPDEDADGSGLLMALVGSLLQDGPPDGYRSEWAVRTKGISGDVLIQTIIAQWPRDAGHRLVDVRTGLSRPIFRNPHWRPGRRAELVDHLVAASRGVTTVEEGWFFTGRRGTLTTIIEWMRRGKPGVRALTGPAGCGKSAVAGRLAALSDPEERARIMRHAPVTPEDPDPGPRTIGAVVHLRGLDVAATTAELALRLGLKTPDNPSDLIGDIALLPAPPVIVCDGLDEAAPAQARPIRRELIEPLGKVALVLLTTRDRPFEARVPDPAAAPGPAAVASTSEIPGAGIPGVDTPAVPAGKSLIDDLEAIDLDRAVDTYDDIRDYVRLRLTDGSTAVASGDDTLTIGHPIEFPVDDVATEIATRATTGAGGFLYARIVTGQILTAQAPAAQAPAAQNLTGQSGPYGAGWRDRLASDIATAFDADLDAGPVRIRDGRPRPGTARDLLRALAFGQGRGLPVGGMWEAIATAVSATEASYDPSDIDWLLTHYGRYVVEDTENDRAAYRLYHREFVQHLRDGAPAIDALTPTEIVTRTLADLAVRQTAVGHLDPYLYYYLHDHATDAGYAGIAILRTLAEANPDAWLPDLAGSLNNLSLRLADVGRREAALEPITEAAALYRTLAEANPDAWLPDLAGSLNNLSLRLADVGRREAALEPITEAAALYRTLAEANPDAWLPDLAMSLNNLSASLAGVGRREAALEPITEAVTIRRRLAEANPDAWLPNLATSLNNLSASLADVGAPDRADEAWHDVLSGFAAGGAARAYLAGTRAAWLIDNDRDRDGVILLATVPPTGAAGPVVAQARRLLRARWHADPERVSSLWADATGDPPPAWLRLPEDAIATAGQWLTTPTWVESRAYLAAHIDRLLSPDVETALQELALDHNTGIVAQHRAILDGVRAEGIDATMEPWLLDELLGAWLDTPTWEESRAFAETHPDVLTAAMGERIAAIAGDRPTAALHVHHAIVTLTLAEGIDTAYRYLSDRPAVDSGIDRALGSASTGRLSALSLIEGIVYGQPFLANGHRLMAAVLAGTAAGIPDEFAALAAGADVADRHRLAAQIAQVMPAVSDAGPEGVAILSALQRIILAPTGSAP